MASPIGSATLMMLDNGVPHLHTHVLPRYVDDPAPGGPIAWEQIFSDDPIDDTVLGDQVAALRARLTCERRPRDRR